MTLSNHSASEEVVPWDLPVFRSNTRRDSNDALAGNTDLSDRTEAEWQEAIEQARQEGFQKGLERGELNAADSAAEEKKRLSILVETIEVQVNRLEDEVMDELLQLSMALSRSILKHELKTDATYYKSLIAYLMEEFALKDNSASIRMHPEDVERCNTSGAICSSSSVQLLADSSLCVGSCLVETDKSYIDVGLDTLLNSLCEKLDTTAQSTEETISSTAQSGDDEEQATRDSKNSADESDADVEHEVESTKQADEKHP
ncbi:MAG: hypothetical protein KTR35_23710 [Gammaproteobacteria bacterium]|nr:hypothetical protein [Gammaproteobacteria bacterium]